MKALTCLRYPGGKSKVVKNLLSPLFPKEFDEYYEPFIGGASVALAIAQLYPSKNIYVNDLNEKVYVFHKIAKEKPEKLVKALHYIRNSHNPNDAEVGKLLLKDMQGMLYNHKDEFSIALAFYVLNKISFSGLTEHGSLSKLAYQKTFNNGNIDRILEISSHMQKFQIFNMHFKDFMPKSKDNDFTFLDPPYQIDSSNLYGKKGAMHSGFDHQEFLESVKSLKGKWMITYNDNEWLRESYKDYNIKDAEYRYCMSFSTDKDGNKNTRMKNELIITNY